MRVVLNYYELVELASKSPVIKRYGLDPEVIVMFALVMDKYIRAKPSHQDLSSHGKHPKVKMGGGNISVAKFAKILSRGLEEMRSAM